MAKGANEEKWMHFAWIIHIHAHISRVSSVCLLEGKAYKKWQLLRGKCNTSDQEAAIRDFPESRWSPLPCGPRFRAPRGSSSLTGTHPSSPPTSSSSSARRWRDGWVHQRCACVSVYVHQVRKKPPVPTRGALGVGSVSYRGLRTLADRKRQQDS